MKNKKLAFRMMTPVVIVCLVLVFLILTDSVGKLDFYDIESVTVDDVTVTDEAKDELILLIQSYRRLPFVVGLDDPNTLSRAIKLNCTNGDFYIMHYQYYSGFSFSPSHYGEDDYRSILTFFDAEKGGRRAWKMEYDFDSKLYHWLSEYASNEDVLFGNQQPATESEP